MVAVGLMPDRVRLAAKHDAESSAYIAASVGAVSADTGQRPIETQWEHPGEQAKNGNDS
jgi:hypothetical protein